MQREMLFWIWLSEALGAGSRDFRKLIEIYETPYEIFLAQEAEIERIEGLSARAYRTLIDKDLQRATEILDVCEQQEITVLPFEDPNFPEALSRIKEPPILLYCKGNLPNWRKRLLIGMVGTRKMSEYGLRSAYKISYELARAGAIVVSGMAAGIDGVCAAGALAAGGETVAILGSGIDIVYPRHHKGLYDRIAGEGLLLSEYAPGTKPNHYHFPMRNRLIAGLTQATVVVEAGIGSGSLITAKDAIVQGKDVFALPANVGSVGAEGTNGLLRDGARPVLQTEDIIKPYLYLYSETLCPEVIPKIGSASRADMRLLDRLGVIELTERQSGTQPEQTASEPPKKQKRPLAEKRRAGAEKTATELPTAEPTERAERAVRETPDATISSLSPIQLAVLEMIPDDRGIAADALAALGYPYGEIASALTMLEILGLVQKLPGAMYVKI